MTYFCPECCVNWWPWQAKAFGGSCPRCGGGTKARQEPGSMDADALYGEALAARKLRDERKANELAFEEYWEAWCNNERDLLLESVQQDLDALPVAEPRRDLAT